MECPSSLPESAGPGDDPDPGHLHLSAPPAGSPQGVLAALRPLLRQRHHGGQVYRKTSYKSRFRNRTQDEWYSCLLLYFRCILDMVVESFATLRRPTEKKDEGETTDDRLERIASPYASKMLNLLAYVLSQPSVKCAALQLMTQNRCVSVSKNKKYL